MFKDYKVVYQMRPFFLRSKTTGAQLSYDIFISGLNVAIEYQGVQHFQPVEFFGGEKNFERQLIRDREKYELSKENNVYLVYIKYDEEISEELIKNKVNIILNTNKDWKHSCYRITRKKTWKIKLKNICKRRGEWR